MFLPLSVLTGYVSVLPALWCERHAGMISFFRLIFFRNGYHSRSWGLWRACNYRCPALIASPTFNRLTANRYLCSAGWPKVVENTLHHPQPPSITYFSIGYVGQASDFRPSRVSAECCVNSHLILASRARASFGLRPNLTLNAAKTPAILLTGPLHSLASSVRAPLRNRSAASPSHSLALFVSQN